MKVFDISMLTICAMSAGMKLMAGNYIVAAVMILCTAYWFIKLIKTSKKKQIETIVDISDETREVLNNLGVKIHVNGQEI